MKQFYILLACIFVIESAHTQVPQKLNYQAIARDASGNQLQNQIINVRFTIKDSSATGSIIYQETHPDTTNQFGLFTAVIGAGAVVSGTFPGINWSSGNKFLQVEIDITGGTNYTDMGTTQLLSVPYALNAQTATQMQLNDLTDVNTVPDTGDVVKWNGTSWVSGADSTGGLVLPYADTINYFGTGFEIVNTDIGGAIKGTGTTGVYGISNFPTGIGIRGEALGVNAKAGYFVAPSGYAIVAADGKVAVSDYTQLGDVAPWVKMQKRIGTTAATQGGTVTFAHSLDASKILAVTVIVRGGTQSYVPPSYTGTGGFEYNYFFDGTTFYIINQTGNSSLILSKPFTVLFTYEE